MRFKPELLMLGLSVFAFFYYIRAGESGKVIYWLGSTLLMAGVLSMKG